MAGTAKRIQRKRTKGWKMPANTVYVGRPSVWGNPVWAGLWRNYTAADALRDYTAWVNGKMTLNGTPWGNLTGKPMIAEAKKQLRGKNLACWCKVGDPCHADVLLEIANS